MLSHTIENIENLYDDLPLYLRRTKLFENDDEVLRGAYDLLPIIHDVMDEPYVDSSLYLCKLVELKSDLLWYLERFSNPYFTAWSVDITPTHRINRNYVSKLIKITCATLTEAIKKHDEMCPTEEDLIYRAYKAAKGERLKEKEVKVEKSLYLIFDVEKGKWPNYLSHTIDNYTGENMLSYAHDLILKSVSYAYTITNNNFAPRSGIVETVHEYQDELEKYRDDIIDYEFKLSRTDGLTKENILYNINHVLKLFKNIFKKWEEEFPFFG